MKRQFVYNKIVIQNNKIKYEMPNAVKFEKYIVIINM